MPAGTVKRIENEIPFEVPEGWVWTRLGDVVYINPKNQLDDSLAVSFVPMTMIDDQFANHHASDVRRWDSVKRGFTHFQEGDIGLAKITPCFENRKSVILHNLSNGYGAGTTELHILRPMIQAVVTEYVFWYVKNEMFITKGKQAFSGAVGQQRIGKEYVVNSLIPLPPITEQHRIVKAISSAFAQIDILEKEKADLQSIIAQAKSKILDLAIRGKLVPQDPTDEPASVLFERIRAEKESLIKQGKIKREKNESCIFRGDDKSYYHTVGKNMHIAPYEIPVSWAWASLEQINNFQGKQKIPSSQPTSLFELYSVPIYETRYPEIVRGETIGSSKQIVEKGDVLLCKINPRINRVWYVTAFTKNQTLASSEWIVIRNSNMDIMYLHWALQSSYFRELLLSNVSGVGGSLMRAQPSSVKKYVIPIPPTSEQHRIVAAIEDAFTQLDSILTALV